MSSSHWTGPRPIGSSEQVFDLRFDQIHDNRELPTVAVVDGTIALGFIFENNSTAPVTGLTISLDVTGLEKYHIERCTSDKFQRVFSLEKRRWIPGYHKVCKSIQFVGPDDEAFPPGKEKCTLLVRFSGVAGERHRIKGLDNADWIHVGIGLKASFVSQITSASRLLDPPEETRILPLFRHEQTAELEEITFAFMGNWFQKTLRILREEWWEALMAAAIVYAFGGVTWERFVGFVQTAAATVRGIFG